MIDLLTIHIEKIKNNELSISPARWIKHELKYSLQRENIKGNFPIYYEGKPLKYSEIPKICKPYEEIEGQFLADENYALKYQHRTLAAQDMEEAYRARMLYQHPTTEIEVLTKIGRIDCLTENEIIEIKVANKWKEGLGQILAYRTYYPNHTAVLFLYGFINAELKSVISEICTIYSVELRTKC